MERGTPCLNRGEYYLCYYWLMITEQIPIDQLQFAAYNPRTISRHEFESLQRSIDEFGFVEPVVVNRRNYVIVGGHQRVRAARELGHTEVPVYFVDLDEAHEKALNIALNKISGEFDTDQLAELISGLDTDLIELTGFDEKELQSLQDGFVDHNEINEPKEPKTVTCPQCQHEFEL